MTFSGKQKERFRYAHNWLARRDYRFQEMDFSIDTASQIRAVSDAWKGSRIIKSETAFLNQPFVEEDEPDTRRFFLFDRWNNIKALVFFDPLYWGGLVVGYVTTHKRRLPDAPSVSEQGICKVAIDRFKSEGKSIVHLGLSPLADISDSEFRYNWILKHVFR